MNTQIIPNYYKKRANEYEKIYYRNDPVRQLEQSLIALEMQKAFIGRSVLEVACGTGYWTEFLSKTAKKIIATDYIFDVIEIAKTKKYLCPVKFKKEDAYNLSFRKNTFTGGMANFWMSHIPKEKINDFLLAFHRTLKKGSVVFFVDNVYFPGVGGKLITKKGDKNTYKIRELSDGSKTEVLKNYFTKGQLRDLFLNFANKDSLNIYMGKCFWYATYIKK